MDPSTLISLVVLSTLTHSLVSIHVSKIMENNERKLFLRSKYEEFGELALLRLSELESFTIKNWTDAYNSRGSKTESKLIIQSTIYFKEFERATFEFTETAEHYENELLRITSKLSNETIWLQAHENSEIDNAKTEYEDAKNNWRLLYIEQSKKYTSIK